MKKIHDRVFEFKLEHCYREYQERTEIWRDIETKARGMLALCSALLLAVFYVITDLREPSLLVWIFLAAAFAALLGAIAYSSWSLRVQDYESIEDSHKVIRCCEQTLMSDSAQRQEEEFRRYKDKYADGWARISFSLCDVNQRKAKCLSKAEGFLFVAIAALAISMIVHLAAVVGSQVCFMWSNAGPCATT